MRIELPVLEMPYLRELRGYEDFYKRWSSEVFTFCLLLCGQREPAELCTEQAFLLFFRSADCVPSRAIPEIPVALLRFVIEIAEIRSQERLRTEVNSRTQALLTLPFRNRGCGRDTAARPCELRFCETQKHRKFPRLVHTNQQGGHPGQSERCLGTLGFLGPRYPRHEPAGLTQRDATAAGGEDGFRFGCGRSAVPKLQTKCDW